MFILSAETTHSEIRGCSVDLLTAAVSVGIPVCVVLLRQPAGSLIDWQWLGDRRREVSDQERGMREEEKGGERLGRRDEKEGWWWVGRPHDSSGGALWYAA